MSNELLSWQGLTIEHWKNVPVSALLKTPIEVLEAIASAGWPIRVLKDNIFQYGVDQIGIVESFERRRGSIIINLKLMNLDPEKIRSNVHWSAPLNSTTFG